jgi:hypothetical protein
MRVDPGLMAEGSLLAPKRKFRPQFSMTEVEDHGPCAIAVLMHE